MPAPELSELFAAIANPPKAQAQPLRLITCVRLGYTTIGTNVPNSGVRGSPGTTGSRGSAALAAKPIKCFLYLNTAAMNSTKYDTSMYSFTHTPRAARLWSRHRRECVTNYYTHGACDDARALADCMSAHWDVAEHHPLPAEDQLPTPSGCVHHSRTRSLQNDFNPTLGAARTGSTPIRRLLGSSSSAAAGPLLRIRPPCTAVTVIPALSDVAMTLSISAVALVAAVAVAITITLSVTLSVPISLSIGAAVGLIGLIRLLCVP